MSRQSLQKQAWVLFIGIVFLFYSGLACADPPSRVARLGYVAGGVSFSPAGENAWYPVILNRPLTTDDRLWTDASGRTEIEISGALFRLSGDSSLSIVKLDDQTAQLQLTQGTGQLHVRHLAAGQSFEISTPHVVLAVHQKGIYRINVNPLKDSTDIVVRRGRAEVVGDDPAYVINTGQAYRFSGTGLRDYLVIDTPANDDFELWASQRDRDFDNSVSARYVSPDLVGYQTLDLHGSWQSEPGYGYVWVPHQVGANWAPYRDGHWLWINPWGWTWVDDAPWGFTVSHYGRWAHLRGVWCWLPGPQRSRAFYAPALVAFVGGNNIQLAISSSNLSAVSWFPLGPREVYLPPYATSQDYFRRINHSNTLIKKDVLITLYKNADLGRQEHANRRVPGAIVEAPLNSFVRSRVVIPIAPAPEVRLAPRPPIEPRHRLQQRPVPHDRNKRELEAHQQRDMPDRKP